MIGKEVVGYSGVMYPERRGQVIAQESVRGYWVVIWEDGSTESFDKHQIRPLDQRIASTIGVYSID